MTDVGTVVLALATAAGAWVAQPVPLAVGVAAVGGAFALRRLAVLVVGAALLASGLGARAWAGLDPPVVGEWEGRAMLVGDPVPRDGAVRVDVRIRGKRVEAWAYGRAAGGLRARLAGERVWLRGRVRPVPDEARRRLARRHVGGRLAVTEVGTWSAGGPVTRVTNGVRRTLVGGTESLSLEQRTLFTGLVLGDDREQPAEVTADFQGAGLAHLLAVSGQNVAFVLALAGPVLSRLGLRTRALAGAIVLLLFGVLTRWEPSVLRAVGMAALAMTSSTLGRPVSTIRRLALAVTVLLLIDPLLVTSVGFALSVAASAGIAVLAPPLARALPGPRPLAQAVAVTVAAQAGVAPVQLPVFGGIPVASLPANLLAGPAAGPVMTWGVLAGVPAGLVGEPVAALLHLPTGLLVGWVALVARVGAAAPLGDLEAGHAVGLAAVGAIAFLVGAARPRLRQLLVAMALIIVLVPAVALLRTSPATAGRELVAGARLWRAGRATVLVVDRADPRYLLPALRRAGVRRLDVLVVTRPGPAASTRVRPVLRRIAVGLILAPEGHALAQAAVPVVGTVARAGHLQVTVEAVTPRLQVRISSGRESPAPASPAPAYPDRPWLRGAGGERARRDGDAPEPRARRVPVRSPRAGRGRRGGRAHGGCPGGGGSSARCPPGVR